MEEFWILILLSVFATNSLDKVESVQLEELPLQTFDELFVDEWWDKDEAEDLKIPAPTNFGQNVHHQIDRQNIQIGQIESNPTDQNPSITESDHSGQIEPNSTDQNPSLTESDHSGRIEPNSTDQNPPLTESDHSGQIEPNSTDQNPPLTESDHSKQIDEIFGEGWWDNEKDEEWNKLTLEQTFHYQIDRQNTQLGQIEPNSTDQNPPLTESDHSGQIEPNSTDQNPPLTESDHSGQNEPNSTDQNPPLTESDHYGQNEPNSTDQNPPFTEWKSELGQTKPQHKHSHSEQMKLMKRYYEIKDKTPKISDGYIAKMLKIGTTSLVKWKKQFKRQQFYPNSVVEENATENVQEIENSNSGSI
uniref:Uncharacterized protein n=1 Tax=Globodera rostochiensis TaxID=31243 RepID=A0A914H0M3_GLORO